LHEPKVKTLYSSHYADEEEDRGTTTSTDTGTGANTSISGAGEQRSPQPREIQLMAKAPSSKASPNLTHLSSTWLKHISRFNLAMLLLLYVTSLHLIGLYTFTKGFLLTRSTNSTVSPPYTDNNPAPIPPTHSKAVILVIDALPITELSTSSWYPYPSCRIVKSKTGSFDYIQHILRPAYFQYATLESYRHWIPLYFHRCRLQFRFTSN
jgi:hypothetical protein